MNVYSWDDFLQQKIRIKQGSSVTIGNFDGIHLGHKKLIETTVNFAKKKDLSSVVVTFSNSPSEFFEKSSLKKLSTISEKLSILENMSVEVVILIDFSIDFCKMKGETFVGFLCDILHMRFLTVGSDCVLGDNRDTDVLRLQEFSKKFSFDLEVVKPILLNGERISSSSIRSLINRGKIVLACQMLGRTYSVELPVEEAGVFKVSSIKQVVPATGKYSVLTEFSDGKTYEASCDIDSFRLQLSFLDSFVQKKLYLQDSSLQIKKIFFLGDSSCNEPTGTITYRSK